MLLLPQDFTQLIQHLPPFLCSSWPRKIVVHPPISISQPTSERGGRKWGASCKGREIRTIGTRSKSPLHAFYICGGATGVLYGKNRYIAPPISISKTVYYRSKIQYMIQYNLSFSQIQMINLMLRYHRKFCSLNQDQ